MAATVWRVAISKNTDQITVAWWVHLERHVIPNGTMMSGAVIVHVVEDDESSRAASSNRESS